MVINLLSEEHRQHDFISLLWKIGQEKNLVGWLLRDSSSTDRPKTKSRSCKAGLGKWLLFVFLLLLFLGLTLRFNPLRPFLECSFHFSNYIRITLGILDALQKNFFINYIIQMIF